MRPLALCLVLLLPVTILAAPAPIPKPARPPLQVTPGAYVLTWACTEYPMILRGDSSYHCQGVGAVAHITWTGHWSYDPKTRVLTVDEWELYNPVLRTPWTVTLDSELEGYSIADGRGQTSVKLKRRKP